jgi:hypothetical protein
LQRRLILALIGGAVLSIGGTGLIFIVHQLMDEADAANVPHSTAGEVVYFAMICLVLLFVIETSLFFWSRGTRQ